MFLPHYSSAQGRGEVVLPLCTLAQDPKPVHPDSPTNRNGELLLMANSWRFPDGCCLFPEQQAGRYSFMCASIIPFGWVDVQRRVGMDLQELLHFLAVSNVYRPVFFLSTIANTAKVLPPRV